MPDYPQRLVCLTTETVEIAYALGAGDRVVGVTGYAVRPPEARRKPHVGAFTSARIDRILALQPDLVLTFSDLQRDIARDLIGAGVNMLALNQRTLEETFRSIHMVGGVLGQREEADALVASMRAEIDVVRQQAARLPRRPRVLFEEWYDPLIAGIAWVSELIEIAGGDDLFVELRDRPGAAGRVIDPDEARRRDPELLLASWCGRKFVPEQVRQRPGWHEVSAVRTGRLVEIKGSDILSPGPSLVRGLRQIHRAIAETVDSPDRDH